jgi:hypothetical protein
VGKDRIQPGDLINLDAKLRLLMDEYGRSAYLLESSFVDVDIQLEAKAIEARPIVRAAADAVYEFLVALEKSPAYRAQKKEI